MATKKPASVKTRPKRKAPAKRAFVPQRAFKPTDEQRSLVANLVAFGITQEDIARVIIWAPKDDGVVKPIDVKTLRAHFAEELATGLTKLLAQVGAGLARTALNEKHPGHVASSIFILKARGGWSEKTKIEGELTLKLEDLAGASDEELAVLERFLLKKAIATIPHVAANAA